jgi:hypothetical protein
MKTDVSASPHSLIPLNFCLTSNRGLACEILAADVMYASHIPDVARIPALGGYGARLPRIFAPA